MRVVEGGTQQLRATFVDDNGDALLPTEFGSGPLVTVLTTDADVVYEGNAYPVSGEEGVWECDVSVPVMGLVDEITTKAVWVYDHQEGRERQIIEIIIEPERQQRVTDIVVEFIDIKLNEKEPVIFDVVVPWRVEDGDTVNFALSFNNTVVARYSTTDPDVEMVQLLSDRTVFELPVMGWPGHVAAHMLMCTLIPGNRASGRRRANYGVKLWASCPQIAVARSMLHNFVDRARLENVIPELEYTEADLMEFLARGLAMFNQLPPRSTGFNGINMQGTMLESWIVCASIQALSSQFLAEGALAFDLSGQAVSLNMDRTPAIEATLGRLQDQLNSLVMPYKKLLGRAGVSGGDGSIGSQHVDGAKNYGVLGVTMAPTTKWYNSAYGRQQIWMAAHYGLRR